MNQIDKEAPQEEELKEDLAKSIPIEEEEESKPVVEPSPEVEKLDAVESEKENKGLLDNAPV